MAPDRQKATRHQVVTWIEHILERKRWTGTDLARNAKLAPSTILRLLNDPNHAFIPTLKTLQKIADASGFPVPNKVVDVLGGPNLPSDRSEDQVVRPLHNGSAVSYGTVPLKVISNLPAQLQPKRESMTTIAAFPQVANDETAFAVHMPDNSLEPWIRAGTLLYCTMRRDPMVNDVVVITMKEGHSCVRLLKDIDSQGMHILRPPISQDADLIEFDKIDSVATVVATLSP
jgi:transcriptional regulator with XRE-family HTH domain